VYRDTGLNLLDSSHSLATVLVSMVLVALPVLAPHYAVHLQHLVGADGDWLLDALLAALVGDCGLWYYGTLGLVGSAALSLVVVTTGCLVLSILYSVVLYSTPHTLVVVVVVVVVLPVLLLLAFLPVLAVSTTSHRQHQRSYNKECKEPHVLRDFHSK